MNKNGALEILKGITITSVHIKDEAHFAFVGQRFINDDAWEHVLTYVIFYFADKPENERWVIHELDYMTDANGVIGVWCEQPEPLWLFGYKRTGLFYTYDKDGRYTGTEQIPDHLHRGDNIKGSFFGLSNINNGKLYTVKGLRTVWQRSGKNQWSWLNNGIPLLDYYNRDSKDSELTYKHGFDSIDGFSDNDLYACGGDGDLWHYNGTKWSQKELPTNAALEEICCGGDGFVYIITNRETIVTGREDRWKVIEQDLTSITFEGLAWYQDRCLINTGISLYEINNGAFVESPLQQDIPTSPSHIDAKVDLLLIASSSYFHVNNVHYYDAKTWHTVLTPDRPPRDPNAETEEEINEKVVKARVTLRSARSLRSIRLRMRQACHRWLWRHGRSRYGPPMCERLSCT